MATAAATMKITKISPYIGAEVTGIDLTKPVDAETRRRLHDAAVEHVCLVVRDQHFTPEQFYEAVKLFGEPMPQHNERFSIPGLRDVNMLSNRNTDKAGQRIKVGMKWHTDHTNHTYPPKFTMLYAVELPDSGGNTSVVNMRAGFESLPEDMKKRLDGMKTVNVRLGSAVKDAYNTNSIIAQAEQKPIPVLQPLVRTNGDNGTKAIYCHPNKTENIVGMSPEDSQALIADIVERTVKPEFIYSHKWRLGDLFLWDNRSSMHKAGFDYDQNQHRLMYRALVKGELPH
jgi:taurine dioxygenase